MKLRKIFLLLLLVPPFLLASCRESEMSGMSEEQFSNMANNYLKSVDGQETLANALLAYEKRRREEAEKKRLEAQFKNPVNVEIGKSPVKGPNNAKITIVEFSDFECPFCSRGTATMREVLKMYPNDVKLVFKHRPLPMHQNAASAAKASLAAGIQGKFWEMHDALFDNQRKLGMDFYVETAQNLGLNVEKFKKDIESPEVDTLLKADESEAERLGVGGTPAFFVNGVSVQGAQPIQNFKAVIDRLLSGNVAK